ncbi:MAG TPA: substrate-binding domain-containing protein [Conexibacter sp.]
MSEHDPRHGASSEPGREERSGPRISRRTAVVAGAASSLSFAIAACGGSSTKTTEATAAGGGASFTGKKRSLVWVAAVGDWNLGVDVGFNEACGLLGWEYKKVGYPLAQYSAATHVDAIKRAILSHPDVLVAPNWVAGVGPALAEAQKKGIYVIVNNANNYPDRITPLGAAFIGQNEYNAGYRSGEALVQLLGRQGKKSGTVIGGNPYPQNANLQDRVRGAAKAFEDWNARNGGSMKVETFLDQSAVNQGTSVSAYKAKMTQLGGDFVGVFTATDTSTQAAVKALQGRGASVGEAPVAAVDVSTAALDQVEQGWVSHIVNHQYYAEGFIPPLLAWQALERAETANGYDAGGELIGRDNLAAAKAREEKFARLGKEYGVTLS